MRKLIGRLTGVICVLTILADVVVNIYSSALGFHLRNEISVCNYTVMFYVMVYLLDKYFFHKALTPGNDRKGYTFGGIICLAFAFGLFVESVQYIFNLQVDAKNYTSGNIIQDTIKVYNRTTSRKKGCDYLNIENIYAKSVKTGKELDFHDCYFLYEGDVVKGKTYKIKYLPTSNTLVSIHKK